MENLLELKGVSKSFSLGHHKSKYALNNVNLTIQKGETLGIVGESGCGKSTLARVIMGAIAATEGEIIFEGNQLKLGTQRLRKEFASHAQMIFQDPFMSLDPRMTVESIIAENLLIHGIRDKRERTKRVFELLELTGLSKEHAKRFPHEFSGGQRQRIGIARALAAKPQFIVCDEPISALDSSVQSQIMNLLINLKRELGLTYLFIAHDLNMVRYISDRTAVIYSGSIVESGRTEEVYHNPKHPYTKMLLNAVLPLETGSDRLECADNLYDEGNKLQSCELGCGFAARCPIAGELCRNRKPELVSVDGEHQAACHVQPDSKM